MREVLSRQVKQEKMRREIEGEEKENENENDRYTSYIPHGLGILRAHMRDFEVAIDPTFESFGNLAVAIASKL